MADEEIQQPRLDSWDDFAGDWIKAEFIPKVPATLMCISVTGLIMDDKTRLVALVEYNERQWKFDLNKTNQAFLRANGISAPSQIVGKQLIVEKTKVRNPSTNAQVDSLVITSIK